MTGLRKWSSLLLSFAPLSCLSQWTFHMCVRSVTQLGLTLWDPMDCSLSGSSAHGIFPGKNTGVGCRFLLQWIFPPEVSSPGLPIAGRFSTARATWVSSPVLTTGLHLYPLILCRCLSLTFHKANKTKQKSARCLLSFAWKCIGR